MKNFTFLLMMLLISFGLSAKNSNELQKKMQQKQGKISEMTQRKAKLNNLLNLTNSEAVLKSAAATHKLDSTVDRVLNAETQAWHNDYKDEFLYDSEMKTTAWLQKEWNLSTNTWDVISNIELEYDNNDRINSMLMYDKDPITSALIPYLKFLYFYNSEGMQDSTFSYSTENTGVTWVLDMKQINYYNASKQLIKSDIWSLDEEENLVLGSYNVYTYTASGKIKTSSMNLLMEGEEIPWSKVEYNYDGSDKLTSTENSEYSFETLALEKSSRNTFQYNASGYVSVDIYSRWIGADWVEYDKTEYEYNTAGDISVEIHSEWIGATWVDKDKTEYEYNAAGDVSVEIYSIWNGTSWVGDYKDEYTYSDMSFSDVVFPYFSLLFDMENEIDLTFNKAIAGVNSFEMVDGSWKNTNKTTLYYSAGPSTNISEIENSVISVYPNPASESIKFNWKGNNEALTLQIYQITGTKVIDQIVYSGRPVTISHLEDGVYLYKLLNGQQKVKVGKLIKK